MPNRNKRLKGISANQEQSSCASTSNGPGLNTNGNSAQLGDSIEIKQEGDIKQEPVYVDELVETSTSSHRNEGYATRLNARDAEDDFDDSLSGDDVKVELKEECGDKGEEESKKKNYEDSDSERDQQQPSSRNVNDFQPTKVNNSNDVLKQSVDAHGNPSKPHKCNFCVSSFAYKSHWDRHLIKHTGEQPHACDFCPKRFTRKTSLQCHMKTHVEEFLFHCSGCLQGFDDKSKKVAHEMNCIIRRYECYLCNESFGSNKSNMIHHVSVHSGEKPFECKECFNKFTRNTDLNRHMKLHNGPRLFRCSMCHQKLSRQDERDAHEEKCNRRPYECDICGKSFGLKKSNLITHMRIHSGETPFECRHCLKQFKTKNGFNNHMRSHTKKLPFKCTICRHGFSKQTQQKAHERNCTRRSYECYLCKSFFSFRHHLVSHMHIHSGDKKFKCKLCQNKFVQKSNLKRHIAQAH